MQMDDTTITPAGQAGDLARTPLLRGTLVSLGPWRDDLDCPGEQRRFATLAVWCPHCQMFHHHGWDPADNGRVQTHRGAHCHDRASPFQATGYFISTLRTKDPGYGEHVTRPGVPVRRVKTA